MIIGSNKNKLEDIMRDMKRHTSEKLREAIKFHPAESRRECLPDSGGDVMDSLSRFLSGMERAGKQNGNNLSFQLWRQDNHPIEMKDSKHLHDTLDYIHNILVHAGFVEKAEDYLYSNARNYYGLKGMIETKKVDPLLV